VEGETPKSGALHAEQHFEFARPIRPGDVLTVETRQGETWEKVSKRGGVLTFSESVTDYRDASGELVCRARMVVVTRGQQGSAP
jgi:acyl-CoA thioesterase FadM